MSAAQASSPQTPLTSAEILQLCAADTDFFARTFFPQTVRQRSPDVHKIFDQALDDPRLRFVAVNAFRGLGKTSKLRIFAAKRIAFALSHTIFIVSASEPHSVRTIIWLRSRIARPDKSTGKLVQTPFAKFFGLRPGSKWNDTELEIISDLDKRSIWVLGGGITGNVRGVNFDDYRPDLILLDDILTDENASSPEQRDKITNLVFGAIKESLVPISEDPTAKMVLLQTPQNTDDVVAQAKASPEFYVLELPCWTEATMDLPLAQQESCWPERYPSEVLRAEKQAAIETNRYSVFAREKECRLVTAENAAFRQEWLKKWTIAPAPMFCVLAIDPVPPPTTLQLSQGLKKKDFEALAVVGRRKGEYFLLDYVMHKGHDPSWTAAQMFDLGRRHRIARVVVESIAYQAVLKYILQQEMIRKGIFFAIHDFKDKRKKYNRIVSTLAGPAQQGRFWIGAHMVDFVSQFSSYPNVSHDDLLDAVAMGLSELVNPTLENGDFDEDSDPYEDMSEDVSLSELAKDVDARRLAP